MTQCTDTHHAALKFGHIGAEIARPMTAHGRWPINKYYRTSEAEMEGQGYEITHSETNHPTTVADIVLD